MGETRVQTPLSTASTKPEIPEMRYGKGEYHGPSREELGTMEFPDPSESDATVVQNGLERFEAAPAPETPSQANVRVKMYPEYDASSQEGEAEDYESALGITNVRIGSSKKPSVK